MIAVDTNILVYAHIASSPWNERAYAALAELAESGFAWAIPWHCLHEFYAIVTHPKIYKPATGHRDALDQLDKWLEAPTLTLLPEGAGTWPLLRQLLAAAKVIGPAVYDARIAAVCLEHGVTELWSADRDFSRFPSLRIRNPLVDPLPTRAGEPRAAYQLGKRRRAAVAAGRSSAL
jgi:toxin-antitoxin system PIN domain toxin